MGSNQTWNINAKSAEIKFIRQNKKYNRKDCERNKYILDGLSNQISFYQKFSLQKRIGHQSQLQKRMFNKSCQHWPKNGPNPCQLDND
jgi:hypothetical protein